MNKGTLEGTEEEITFVKKLNKKRDLSFWNIININPKDHFAVHVSNHKYAKINGQLIKPKADVFIAEGNVKDDVLENKDYYLNELSASELNLKPLAFTGISIKRIDSDRYQILKMNPNTFSKLFGSYELGAGASIFCTKKEELIKNEQVISGWNTTWGAFEKFFAEIEDVAFIKGQKCSYEIRLKIAKKVKTLSNKKIAYQININEKISKFVFQGMGNFDEPFTAFWFYEKGLLKKAGPIPFCVTTGSGRSKGDFTIVIKPKN